MKIKVELNKTKKYTAKKTDRAKAWFLENTDKIEQHLARLSRGEKGTQIIISRIKSGTLLPYATDNKKIKRGYFLKLYANKFEILFKGIGS